MKVYKNSHTTSTKCQYQIDNSTFMWCILLRIPALNRNIDDVKKIVPTRTCIPWKPVAKKKEEPNEESEMEKDLSKYSHN